MAATEAEIGYGAKYHIGGVEIAEVFDIVPGELVADQVDATHYQSPSRRREKIGGLIDTGEATFQINWLPGSSTDVLLRGYLASGDRVTHMITFPPDDVTVSFTGAVTGYTKAIPIDDRMTATITVTISGDEVWSA